MKIHFDTPPAAAQQANGLAVRYAAAKREVPRWRWYLMVALISVPILYFALPFAGGLVWRTAPAVILMQTVVIKSPADGEVADLIKAGSAVTPGTALAVIERPRLVSAVTVGQALPLNLPPTAAGPSPTQAFAQAPDAPAQWLREAVSLAERERTFRHQRVGVVQSLLREGAATRAEVQSAQAAEAQAEATLVRARFDLAQHERQRQAEWLSRRTVPAPSGAASGTAPGGASSASGGMAGLDAPVAVATSPFKGKVTSVLATPGEAVTSASELMVVQGEGPPVIEAYLSPADTDLARVGRRASLRFLDGGQLDAVVQLVQPQASRLPADRLGPLSPRSQAIVVQLRPVSPLPQTYRIHQLPLNVRFGLVLPWENSEKAPVVK